MVRQIFRQMWIRIIVDTTVRTLLTPFTMSLTFTHWFTELRNYEMRVSFWRTFWTYKDLDLTDPTVPKRANRFMSTNYLCEVWIFMCVTWLCVCVVFCARTLKYKGLSVTLTMVMNGGRPLLLTPSSRNIVESSVSNRILYGSRDCWLRESLGRSFRTRKVSVHSFVSESPRVHGRVSGCHWVTYKQTESTDTQETLIPFGLTGGFCCHSSFLYQNKGVCPYQWRRLK